MQSLVRSPSRAPTILVVSADLSCTAMCADVLEAQGHRVIVADDGDRALRLAIERRPDVVLTDLHLPSIAGDLLVRRLRKAGVPAPVVLMSDAVDGVARARRCRADAYLPKPFDVGAAGRAVARMLTRN